MTTPSDDTLVIDVCGIRPSTAARRAREAYDSGRDVVVISKRHRGLLNVGEGLAAIGATYDNTTGRLDGGRRAVVLCHTATPGVVLTYWPKGEPSPDDPLGPSPSARVVF